MDFYKDIEYRPFLKILNIFLVMVMLLAMYALFFARFIPSSDYYFYSLVIWQPITIVLFFVYFKINARAKRSLILLPVFMLFFYLAFSIGLPSTLNHIISSSETIYVTVKSKSRGGYRGNCRYRLNVKELVNTISIGLCVSEHDYKNTSIGSKIKLSGNSSWLGIHVKSIYI